MGKSIFTFPSNEITPGKRAINNFERQCAFPGRLTGVPGKQCFVNAAETLYASVGITGGVNIGVEKAAVVEKFES